MSYPLWENSRNERKIMKTRKDNTLESLDEKVRTWILETAPYANLTDMVVNLQKQGISTSVPSKLSETAASKFSSFLLKAFVRRSLVGNTIHRGEKKFNFDC